MTNKEKGMLIDMYRKAVQNSMILMDMVQSAETEEEHNNLYADWCKRHGAEDVLWDILYNVCHMSEADIYLIANQAETDVEL